MINILGIFEAETACAPTIWRLTRSVEQNQKKENRFIYVEFN